MPVMMDRRAFLKVSAGGALGLALTGCSHRLLDMFGPEKERLWGMNVHPYTGRAMRTQLAALSELGIRKVRISLGVGRDLASPFIRSYPAEYLGLLTDFELGGLDASSWPGIVRDTVARFPTLGAIEVLNEPDVFLRLPAAVYVRDFLRPAWEIIKEMRPDMPVVAAAPRGTQDGLNYFYTMTDAGADNYCDYRAVHVYGPPPEQYILKGHKPFMVTETGIADRARHVRWWSDDMPHMAKVLDTSLLYWYSLLDVPESGFDIIGERLDGQGQVVRVSPLYEYLLNKY
jgi:hypothetical protein